MREEQYSELPRALSDEAGPHRGSKSKWINQLLSRYQMADPLVFMSITPSIWPVVIIDAMFIINTKPLHQTKTFTVMHIFCLTNMFSAGTLEVYLIFDKPNR